MKTGPRSRWPGRPKPQIAAEATEKVTHSDEHQTASEFWYRGHLVGRTSWSPDGRSGVAVGLRVGLRDGLAVGCQLSYEDGAIEHAEPFVNGELHGLAKQFSLDGRLLLASPFKRGTGIDFWCDDRGRLAEEHPLVEGQPSGTER